MVQPRLLGIVVVVMLALALLLISGYAVAAPVCDGVADDTAEIQQTIATRTPLPRGFCRISATLDVGPGQALLGQDGVFQTILQPSADLTGRDVIYMHANEQSVAKVGNITVPARPVLRNITILGLPGGLVGSAAVHVADDLQPSFNSYNGVDLFQISGVRIDGGKYGLAFLCQNVHSSMMSFTQIFNFQPNTFAAAWLGCTDWTMNQVEVHAQASTSCCGGAVWSWYGSQNLRFFGGNQSIMGARSGSPDNYVNGAGVLLYGTTQYRD